MGELSRDFRYAVRLLLKNPGFTIIAVLTIGLGVGANSAIFSLIDAVLLRPLPFPNPDRLVMVWEDASFAGFPRNTPAPGNYVEWKRQNHVFDQMAALAWSDFSLTGDGEPEKVSGYKVAATFFPLLGTPPLLGRTFRVEEDQPGGEKVAVLSYGLWQRRFGGDSGIVGRDILLNGAKYAVVGVMPRGFQFMESFIGLWVPLALTPEEQADHGSHYLTVLARLKAGVTVQQAQEDVHAITRRIARQHRGSERLGGVVITLREQVAGDSRRPFAVLLASVGLVLLIACANLASLLLSRGASRRREIAVRAALGAGRRRLVRQLLTESVVLSSCGGAVGLLFALWSFSFLQRLIPAEMLLFTPLNLDSRVLAFTVILSVSTGILFGLVPALQMSKLDLNEALKQGGGRSTTAAEGSRLRGALVVIEVALALVLMIGAGLLTRTFLRLLHQYSGLRPENVLTLRTVLPRAKYNWHARRVAFYDQVLEGVTRLPGVLSAGYTTSVPLEWKGGTSGFVVEGKTPDLSLSYDANHRQVSAGYLQAMGISLLRGRYFDQSDGRRSMPVAVVNDTMARQYWPNEDPIGRRFKIGDPDEDVPWLTVVGIVADVRQMGMDAPVKAEMYVPYAQPNQQPWFAPRDLVIRTSGDPMNLVTAVRDKIRDVDPEQPVANVRSMEEILDGEVGPRRLGMLLVGAFAALALVLAGLGLYGILSYFVAQHTSEIGVRLALGAEPRELLGWVVRRGLQLTALGVIGGLVCALALTRWMESLLFEVKRTDPTTYALVVLAVAVVSFLACYVPARRATRVDPIVALRCE